MPRVTIKTGIVAADGHEQILTEYICDWPHCPNPAEHLLGVVADLRVASWVCHEHAALLEERRRSSNRGS